MIRYDIFIFTTYPYLPTYLQDYNYGGARTSQVSRNVFPSTYLPTYFHRF